MKYITPILKFAALAAVAIGIWLWWSHAQTSRARVDKELKRERIDRQIGARLKKSIDLPNGDGLVYVIETPADDFGFEVNTCMIHVKGSASAMACTPPKYKSPSAADDN